MKRDMLPFLADLIYVCHLLQDQFHVDCFSYHALVSFELFV